MTKALVIVMLAMLLVPTGAFAQEDTRAEVFAGYSFMHDTRGEERFPVDVNSNGFQVSGAFYFTSWLAAEAAVAHQPGSDVITAIRVIGPPLPDGGSGPDVELRVRRRLTTTALLAGPRLVYPNNHFRPFGHVLVGAVKGTLNVDCSASGPSGDFGNNPCFGANGTKFGMEVGGGVDVVVSDSISLRPIQADYRHTFDNDFRSFAGSGIRLSSGVVFSFGR